MDKFSDEFEPRTEWMKCVRRPDVPWTFCGRCPPVSEWCFLDLDHAQRNKDQGGRLVTCSMCAAAIEKEKE